MLRNDIRILPESAVEYCAEARKSRQQQLGIGPGGAIRAKTRTCIAMTRGKTRAFLLCLFDSRQPAVDPDAACEVLVGGGHLPPHLGGFRIGLGHCLLAAILRAPEMVLDLVHPGQDANPGIEAQILSIFKVTILS